MRKILVLVLLMGVCGTAPAQQSDAALLQRTRALYDAPFTRNLVSFDCEVQFDWKQHLIDQLGSVPDAVEPTVDLMAAVHHTVSMDRSGARVSEAPNGPDLEEIPLGAQFEQAFRMVISGGLNEWLPFGYGEILPEGATEYSFQKTDAGYTVVLKGKGIASTLYLDPNLKVIRGESELPQPLRFTTEFADGPQGYLLRSMTTAAPGSKAAHIPTFDYTWQSVNGVEIPSQVTVTTGIGEVWKYQLTGCAVQVQTKPPAK
ncbi:MAG: hypothetical protein WCC14_10845 [Acidobacteriaceae bacterium]